ncbi:MAG: DUF128 domain-containing protein [Archaeoglobus sp.]|uniref:DUF128 domain-containing protein n=1 Tax=Archaeoglobus sp. TaxID=1872626 RepID=UPI001DAD7CBA|nr:DUF128 domain-containing protein [Archaeoglobus sp.]MBO8179538.1 DUF128 domain-containing protein [Archaeoglobus sp.]
MVEDEILRVLEETGALSSKEIELELRKRGYNIRARTVRYHLKKLEERGLVRKNSNGKSELTERGEMELKRRSAFERLGEFSERIEYNVYLSNFNLYTLSGLVPTNFAFVDKSFFDKVMEIVEECASFPLLISDRIFISDEGESLGGYYVPENSFALGVISNTIYDVILKTAGVNTNPEFAGLMSVENKEARGLTELISYFGTTLSPGLLLLRAGLTSVYSACKSGRGEIIVAIRSFSRYAMDIARRELEIAESKGLRGVIKILHPADRIFGLPTANRARLVVSAGLNMMAPLFENGIIPEVRVNEFFVDYRDFRKI